MRVAKVILLMLIAIVLIQSVQSAAIGVNKAVLTFNDVLRGGYAEESIYVSTDSEELIPTFIRPEGNISSWFTFEPNVTNTSRNGGGFFKIIVQPPEDTPTGTYEAVLRIGTGEIGRTTGQYGSAIRAGFRIKVTITVTGIQRQSCDAGGFIVGDVEQGGEIPFSYVVDNTGNVRIQPIIEYDIWDKFQEVLITSGTILTPDSVLPTVAGRFKITIPETALLVGQHWIDLTSQICGEEQTLTFNIVERGQISDKGELVRIDAPVWAETGEIVPLKAIFKNTGPRTVAATFNGEVVLDDHVVDLIESETLNVEPGETFALESFFTPKDPGQHFITGRVTYNNKLSFEKRALINVNPSSEYEPTGLNALTRNLLISGGMMIVVIILLIMIGRQRNRRRRPF